MAGKLSRLRKLKAAIANEHKSGSSADLSYPVTVTEELLREITQKIVAGDPVRLACLGYTSSAQRCGFAGNYGERRGPH